MATDRIGDRLGREFTGTDFRWLYNEGGWLPNMIWYSRRIVPDYWPDTAAPSRAEQGQ